MLPMTESARLKAKEAIRRLRARQEEIEAAWVDKCVDAHGMGQESAMNDVGKPALAIIAELCSAIESRLV
jgi:hypothetical protein